MLKKILLLITLVLSLSSFASAVTQEIVVKGWRNQSEVDDHIKDYMSKGWRLVTIGYADVNDTYVLSSQKKPYTAFFVWEKP